MVAVLGETTGHLALIKLRDRMRNDPEGYTILTWVLVSADLHLTFFAVNRIFTSSFLFIYLLLQGKAQDTAFYTRSEQHGVPSRRLFRERIPPISGGQRESPLMSHETPIKDSFTLKYIFPWNPSSCVSLSSLLMHSLSFSISVWPLTRGLMWSLWMTRSWLMSCRDIERCMTCCTPCWACQRTCWVSQDPSLSHANPQSETVLFKGAW